MYDDIMLWCPLLPVLCDIISESQVTSAVSGRVPAQVSQRHSREETWWVSWSVLDEQRLLPPRPHQTWGNTMMSAAWNSSIIQHRDVNNTPTAWIIYHISRSSSHVQVLFWLSLIWWFVVLILLIIHILLLQCTCVECSYVSCIYVVSHCKKYDKTNFSSSHVLRRNWWMVICIYCQVLECGAELMDLPQFWSSSCCCWSLLLLFCLPPAPWSGERAQDLWGPVGTPEADPAAADRRGFIEHGSSSSSHQFILSFLLSLPSIQTL